MKMPPVFNALGKETIFQGDVYCWRISAQVEVQDLGVIGQAYSLSSTYL